VRSAALDTLATTVATIAVLAGWSYAFQVGRYDLTTLFVSIIAPLAIGTVSLSTRKNRILVFTFLAYFWAVVDDGPIYFDSVLTWPEVTKFHPFLPRLVMNVVIHGLTAIFFYLAVRRSMKGTSSIRDSWGPWLLAVVAFVLAYAQNLPFATVQRIVSTDWYAFDLAEKLASVLFFSLALVLGARVGSMTRQHVPSSSEPSSPADSQAMIINAKLTRCVTWLTSRPRYLWLAERDS